ncbi:hypothetical protein D3C80_1400830 [compost metagenome]
MISIAQLLNTDCKRFPCTIQRSLVVLRFEHWLIVTIFVGATNDKKWIRLTKPILLVQVGGRYLKMDQIVHTVHFLSSNVNETTYLVWISRNNQFSGDAAASGTYNLAQ